jgi:hypothetical protein
MLVRLAINAVPAGVSCCLQQRKQVYLLNKTTGNKDKTNRIGIARIK